MTAEEDQPAPPHLDNLAAFLPVFEAPGFAFATMEGGSKDESGAGTMPWSRLSEPAARFVDTAYEDGWVSPEVDWPSWMETEEARRLRDDPAAIPEATVEQLQKLLTTVIRQDRFVTGALAGAFESGMLTAILRRIDQLRLDAAPGSSDN